MRFRKRDLVENDFTMADQNDRTARTSMKITPCDTNVVIYSFPSGDYSFHSWSLNGQQMCTVTYQNPINSCLWDVSLELVVNVGTNEEDSLLMEHSFDLSCSHPFESTTMWPVETLLPFRHNDGFVPSQVSLRVVESHGLPCSGRESIVSRLKTCLDGVLVVDDMQIAVHKASLSFNSPFFDAMFNSDFLERTENSFTMGDVDYDQFACLLRVMYGIDLVNEESLEFLLELSDRYEIAIVKTMCETFMANGAELWTRKRMKYLIMADRHNLSKIQDMVINSITSTAQLKTLSEDVLFEKISAPSQNFVFRSVVQKFG